MTTAAPPVPHVPCERIVLDSGLVLLVSHRPAAPVLAFQLSLRGGHSLDPAGYEGTALLTGALLEHGTRDRDEAEISGLLEGMGGTVSGDAWGLAGQVPGAAWRPFLDLVAELITRPAFPAKSVARQRKRLADRMLVEEQNPHLRASRLFRQLVYGKHWLGRPESGSAESLARIGRRQLTDFHSRNWVASRAVISICGDVRPADVRRHLARRLADWPAGRPLGPRDESFPPRARRARAWRADRNQVHLYLGHLGIRRADPDYPTLVVMDHILGTGPGFANRIPGKLRDEMGLAYSVSAGITPSAGVLPGTFTAYIGTSPEHVRTAIAVFLEEIRRIRSEPPTEEELDLAVRYVTGSMALGFERAAARARYLVFAERVGLPFDHLVDLVARISETTATDVRDAARAHLDAERVCLAAAGPLRTADLRRALGD